MAQSTEDPTVDCSSGHDLGVVGSIKSHLRLHTQQEISLSLSLPSHSAPFQLSL